MSEAEKQFSFTHAPSTLLIQRSFVTVKLARPLKQVFIAFSLALLSSCASIGTKFDSRNAAALELRQLKSSEYLRLFGKPFSTTTSTTADGKYEIVKYIYGFGDIGTARSRVLLMEFKEGVLNSYILGSSFDEDRTTVDPKRVEALKAETGKFSKEDVIAAMGRPHGKAFCPSLLPDYKDRCNKASEIWAWLTWDKVPTLGGGTMNGMTAYVLFNGDGKMVEVQTHENTRRRK